MAPLRGQMRMDNASLLVWILMCFSCSTTSENENMKRVSVPKIHAVEGELGHDKVPVNVTSATSTLDAGDEGVLDLCRASHFPKSMSVWRSSALDGC